jgi:signal transduction histidine kinase
MRIRAGGAGHVGQVANVGEHRFDAFARLWRAEAVAVLQHDLDRVAGLRGSLRCERIGGSLRLAARQREVVVIVATDRRRGGGHADQHRHPGAQLTAYRIVQESLTNVVRHAHASAASVLVRFDPDAIVVQVDDDGRGPAQRANGAGGYGLLGMQERAAAVGGTLESGPRPGGGFRVCAQLPTK